MRRRSKALWSNQRGSAIALVAISLAALVSLLALGIDVGMLFNARSEAQRAADSAALAGASAFLDFPAPEAPEPARERAVAYAIQNQIRNESINESEVTVSVNVDSATVTVRVHRDGVSTWFARVFGRTSVPIGAQATAQATDAGTAQCLKPFAVPDMWDETNDDTNHNRIWDANENWHFDPGRDRYEGYTGDAGDGTETGYGSDWRDFFPNSDGERYHRDYGRRIMIKVSDPHSSFVPSFFYPWVLPVDASQPDCGEDRAGNDVIGNGKGNGKGNGNGGNNGNGNTGNNGNGSTGNNGNGSTGNNGNGSTGNNGNGSTGNNGNGSTGNNGNGSTGNNGNGSTGDNGSGSTANNGNGGNNGNGNGGNNGNGNGNGNTGGNKGRGGAAYRKNICSCNASAINLDTDYEIEPGNMVGPTAQGVAELIDEDPDAYWDDSKNEVVSEFGNDSPRIITVALFDPTQISKGGRQEIRFNNFARFFIEKQDSPQDPVVGRFMFYVAASGATSDSGATTGSLVKRLRLIR